MGGLWDHWIGPDGSELQIFCILTTTPNALLLQIHDRMPVVIMDGLEEGWLLPEAAAELRGLEALKVPWVRWSGFSGQPPSLTSEAGHRP